MNRRELVMCAAGVAFIAGAGPALAYTPKWLQCDGQLVTTGENAGTKPAHDYYVTDDDNRNLFVYLPAKGTESLEPVKEYNDNEITWSMDSRGINNARWHGRLDRKNLGLRLEYVDSGSTLTWTEQCKPTSPVKSSVSADSSKPEHVPAKKSG